MEWAAVRKAPKLTTPQRPPSLLDKNLHRELLQLARQDTGTLDIKIKKAPRYRSPPTAAEMALSPSWRCRESPVPRTPRMPGISARLKAQLERQAAPDSPALLSAKEAETSRLYSPRADAAVARVHAQIREHNEKWGRIINEMRAEGPPGQGRPSRIPDCSRRLSRLSEMAYWARVRVEEGLTEEEIAEMDEEKQAWHLLQQEHWALAEHKLKGYLRYGAVAIPGPAPSQFIPSAVSAWQPHRPASARTRGDRSPRALPRGRPVSA